MFFPKQLLDQCCFNGNHDLCTCLPISLSYEIGKMRFHSMLLTGMVVNLCD